MKGMTTNEHFRDEIKKVLQKLDISIKKLVEIVTDGTSCMARTNSGLALLIIKDVKNTTGCHLFVYLCLRLQEVRKHD
jgi:hypothetical protein